MRCSERGRLGSQPVKALMPGQSPYHELGAKLCGGAYQPDEYSHYSHATPEGEFPARQYRNLLLAPYIEFVDAVWIPEHSEDYFRSHDPLALPPSRRAFYCLKSCLFCPAPDRHLRAEIV
jgi:hypothetical protein